MELLGYIEESVEMQEVVARVKRRIDELSQRPDVAVRTRAIGHETPQAVIDRLRGTLPDELLDFYREMNGVHFEWEFVERGDTFFGAICVPTLDAQLQMGADRDELLFDEPYSELPVLLARRGDGCELFTMPSSITEAPSRWSSIAEYLVETTENAFVVYWPHYERVALRALERLARPPLTPTPLRPGTRIASHTFEPTLRGTIERRVAPEAIADPTLPDDELGYLLVRFDHGVVAWVPARHVTTVDGNDVYEEAVNDPERYFEQLMTQSDADRAASLSLIVPNRNATMCYGLRSSPTSRTTPTVYRVSLRVCALLHPLGADAATTVICDLVDGWLGAPDRLGEGLTFASTGAQVDPAMDGQTERYTSRLRLVRVSLEGLLLLLLQDTLRSTPKASLRALLSDEASSRLEATLDRLLAIARCAKRYGIPDRSTDEISFIKELVRFLGACASRWPKLERRETIRDAYLALVPGLYYGEWFDQRRSEMPEWCHRPWRRELDPRYPLLADAPQLAG
ncbi:MAG: hypothetical protein KC609_24485 [Myxococcales bacterium]|nr:hypothetical protein [Myxococcales bacterium]